VISIVTPWLNAAALIPIYERSVRGAQVIVIDNGSDHHDAVALTEMVGRLGGKLIRNETNLGYSRANNQGLAEAVGDIVVCLNNDVECRPGWLEQVEKEVKPGGFYGPSLLAKHGWQYIEGYCIAAKLKTWRSIAGWDDTYYAGLYWEDNDLCARAVRHGMKLVKTNWPIFHANNYTSNCVPGAKDSAPENERRFLERVNSWHA